MNSKELISLSILSAKEGKELPDFAVLSSPVCQMIIELINDFDYSQSKEFLSKIDGKSETYKTKLLSSINDPVKAKNIKDNFLQSVRNIQNNDDILAYISQNQVTTVSKIRELLANASNS